MSAPCLINNSIVFLEGLLFLRYRINAEFPSRSSCLTFAPFFNKNLIDFALPSSHADKRQDLAWSFKVRFPNVKFPPVPARGDLDLELVRKSIYFFA